MKTPNRTRIRRLGWLGGALLTTAVGLFWLLVFPLGLARLSLDLPFAFQRPVDVNDVVVVFLDEESGQQLNQPPQERWDRRLHARLLQRLTHDGARLVFFDVLFDSATPADAEFAEAIRKHGNVILAATPEPSEHDTGSTASFRIQRLIEPTPVLRAAARGVGSIAVHLDREQQGTRRLFTGGEAPAAIWLAAEAVGAPVTRDPAARGTERWLNFYRPSPAFDSVSLHQALDTNGVPARFFAGKHVFVGGAAALFGDRERFATPFGYIPGVELLATGFMNLVRGDWLERVPDGWQVLLVIGWGVALGGLARWRPWHAAWVAALGGLVVAGGSIHAQFHHHHWWTWLVPAAVQPAVALVWSIGFQYATEGRRRRQLTRAFSIYLSPHLARRIADSEFDLSLGGQEVEATVMFTDLEGFTALSEKLTPTEVSQMLTAYFSRTTRHILERDGTIIKYIGDAVMAVWGAPLPDANQGEKAVRAACGMIQSGQEPILGRRLRTRIGISTGLGLAGNLGSDFRADYTVVGANTNLASRLEKLNQLLGTEILITEATRSRLSEEIRVRFLGRFLAKGITEPFAVYEVLGTSETLPALPSWVEDFDRALAALTRSDWAEAERLLTGVMGSRGGRDGPSAFYLEQLKAWQSAGKPWDGVVRGA